MDRNIQIIAVVAVLAVVIGLCAMVMVSNNNDANWEEMTENALESKGYRNIHIASCTHVVNGESASTSGTFSSDGEYCTYIVSFIKEGGNWKAYRVTVM